MTNHDLVKGIDAPFIARIMLAEFARLFLVGALALGVIGFTVIGIVRAFP